MRIHRNIVDSMAQGLRSLHESFHSLAEDMIAECGGELDPLCVQEYTKRSIELANALREYGHAFSTLLARYNDKVKARRAK